MGRLTSKSGELISVICSHVAASIDRQAEKQSRRKARHNHQTSDHLRRQLHRRRKRADWSIGPNQLFLGERRIAPFQNPLSHRAGAGCVPRQHVWPVRRQNQSDRPAGTGPVSVSRCAPCSRTCQVRAATPVRYSQTAPYWSRPLPPVGGEAGIKHKSDCECHHNYRRRNLHLPKHHLDTVCVITFGEYARS